MSRVGRARRPHFIIAVWGLTPGGTLSVLREWVPRLERAGAVSVVSLGPNRASLGVHTVEIGARFSHPLRFPQVLGYIARMALACGRVARRGGRPVLIPQDALATGAAAALAAAFTGARLVVMEHGSAEAIGTERFWRERYPPAGRFGRVRQRILRSMLGPLQRWVLRRTDLALIAGDEALAVYRAHGVPDERLVRYHFSVDLDRFHPPDAAARAEARARWDIAPDADVVISVARLAPEKGIDDILAAAAAHLQATVIVAGDGPLRAQLEREAPPNARFVGRLERDEVASLHRAADVFVYAGRQGANTPYAVLEAMASGLPVIATTAPEVHRAMLAEGRGIAVPPGDRAALTAAVGELLGDEERRAHAARGARAYVEANHAPARLDAEVEAFLSRLGEPERSSL